MTFLHAALFAAGAACIAIPIIIHLLMHRRRKPVMWGAMRFLVEAYKRQRRRLMVEKWLLLATRCLVILLLALAVGRPLLERIVGSRGGKTIYLLVDNGVGSAARDVGGSSALERHKAAAKAILATVRTAQTGGAESDRVGLIALGGPAEPVVVPASANLGSIEALIDSLEPTDSKTDLPGGLSRVSAAIGGTEESGGMPGSAGAKAAPDRTFVVVLSDFTDGSADLSAAGDALGAAKLPEGVKLIASEPAMNALSNVAITGVEPLRSVLIDSARSGGGGGSADAVEQVRVLLARTGDGVSRPAVTTLRARLAPAEGGNAAATDAGSAAEQTVVRWAAGQETATAVTPVRADRKLLAAARGSAGASGASGNSSITGAVLIASIDDDSIGADNRWRRPIELREALKVGVVAPIKFGKAERVDKLDPGSWARLALQPSGEGTGIDVTDIEPASLDQARLAGLDAVIIARPDLVSEASWSRIKLFVESGGLAMIVPPPGLTTHVWGDAMSRGLGVEWTPAREAKGVAGSRVQRVQNATGNEGSANVLALVEGELDELLAAVSVKSILPLNPAPESGQVLLKLDDGTPLLWVGEVGKAQIANGQIANKTDSGGGRGMVVYLGVGLDLEDSDLPAKPLMVPLMQELVRQGVGRARGSWWSVAGARPAVPSRTAELRQMPDPARARQGEDRDRDALARIKVDGTTGTGASADPIRRAGVYKALDERGADRGIVAVNADARGTRTGVQTRDAVGAWLRQSVGGRADTATAITWIPTATDAARAARAASTPDASGVSVAVAGLLGKSDRGSPISLPLLIGALALAMFEVFLARRASHAEITTDAGTAPGDVAPATESRSTGNAGGMAA